MHNTKRTKRAVSAFLLALIAVCVCAFALSACGGKKALERIEITTPPAKTEYTEGEKFNPEGMVVTAFYSNDSSAPVTEYSIRPDSSVALDTTYTKVSVFYTEGDITKSADIAITVKEAADPEPPAPPAPAEKTISAAIASKAPDKASYTEGETFKADGMEWTVVYSDLSTDTVKFTAETEYTVDITRPLQVSDLIVKVTYKGYTLPVPVVVTPVAPPADITDYTIMENPDKTEYFEGQSFEIDGLEVLFYFDDGTSKTVTFTSETEGVTVEPADFDGNPNANPNYEYPDEVEITYKGFTFSVPVSVKYPAVTELSIVNMPAKTEYMAGERFDSTGLIVRVTWEDNYSLEYPASVFAIPSYELQASDTKVVISFYDQYYHRYVRLDVPVRVIQISNVTVTAQPDKTEYVAGESFEPAGMVLEVTYSDGNSERVDVVRGLNGLTLPERALTASDGTVTVYYYNYPVNVDIRILKGVYIEAEDAVINSTKYKTPADAVDKNGVPNASGGKYVSDLEAGDSVAFSFYSDKAGKGNLAFILASKYLKEDYNWTPVVMGDCRFNLICEFSVNGVQQEIPDSVILPGGEAETSAGAAWLWYNWKEVVFENVDFIQGRNEVVLEFIPHHINDCSQPSFNNTFTANVDSLKVTSDGCEVGPYSYEYSFTKVGLRSSDDEGYLVLTGDLSYYNFNEQELAEALKRSLKVSILDYYNYNAAHSLIIESVSVNKSGETQLNGQTLCEGAFEVLVPISTERYPSTYVVAVNGEWLEQDVDYAADHLTLNYFYYGLLMRDDYACLAIGQGSMSLEYTATGAQIIEEDGKAVYCLSGTISTYGYLSSDIKKVLMKEYFNLQLNPEAAGNGSSWTEIKFTPIDVIIGNGEFTIKYDISDLDDYCYTTHFGMNYNWEYKWVPADVKLDEPKNETIEIGGKRYTLISVPNSDEGRYYWGCVGVKIETL